jgi:hypothetical protein
MPHRAITVVAGRRGVWPRLGSTLVPWDSQYPALADRALSPAITLGPIQNLAFDVLRGMNLIGNYWGSPLNSSAVEAVS